MRLITRTLTTLAIAAASAAALEKEFVGKMLTSARNIERDALAVHQALKGQKLDSADVLAKIEAMGDDVTKLNALVSQFEATAPRLSERDQADWKLIKEKIQLLEIFHSQKKQLASGDLARNRSLIRAHAGGLAKRAKMLQETASRLERSPQS